MENYKLIIVKNPFNKRNHDIKVSDFKEKTSIADVVALCELPKQFEFSISLNGSIIQKDNWSTKLIRPNDQLIIAPVIEGGGGNDILRALLMIAVLVASVMLGPEMATLLYPVLGAVSPAIYTGLLMMVGGMLVNLLVPPTMPQAPDVAKSTQAYSWNPQTVQQQGVCIARYYGVNKVYGNIISAYIEHNGEKQTLNALIDLGTGPIQSIGYNPYDNSRAFWINDQPDTNFKEIQIETRLGNMDQDVIPAFNDTPVSLGALSQLISYDSGAITYLIDAPNDYDAFEIEVTATRGLWKADATEGGYDRHSVTIKIEIRKDGAGSWYPITHSTETKQVTITEGVWSAGYWTSNEEGFGYWYEITSGGTDPDAHYEGETYPYDGYVNAYWTWLDNTHTEIVTSEYDYEYMTGKIPHSLRKVWKVDSNVLGHSFEIRLTKLSSDRTNENKFGDSIYLTNVTKIYYDDFQYPRTALVAVRALATDQLSGSLRFSTIIQGAIVRTYDDSAGWVSEYSNNPAWVAYDILTQPVLDNNLDVVRYDGIDPSRMDLVAFQEWADYCNDLVPDGNGGTEKRCEFDGCFDSEMTMWTAALQVASVSRATIIWNGSSLTVSVDKERTTPIQLFTVGNINTDSFIETFLPFEDRASEIEADFVNRDNGFDRDKASVMNASIETTTSKVNLQMFGVTRSSQVWRECMYRLNKNQYIFRTATLEADIDAIACTIGDLVYVQHDVPQWGQGGRVVSATINTVTLDKNVTIQSGEYEIMIRLSDDTIVTKTVLNSAESTNIIQVADFDSIPEQFNVYAFGKTGISSNPFVVTGFSKTSEQKVTLQLVEYNASIYGSDENEPVLPTIDYTDVEVLPSVGSLTLSDIIGLNTGGAVINKISIGFTLPISSYYSYAEVWYKSDTTNWTYAGRTLTGEYVIENVKDAETYTVSVCSVNILNQRQSVQNGTQATVYINGKLEPPSDVSNLYGQASLNGLRLDWTAVTDIDLDHYLIRFSPDPLGSWESAIDVMTVYGTSVTLPAALDGTYFVKAIDTSGVESLIEASYYTTIPSMIVFNVQDEIICDPTWDDTKVDVSISSSGALLLDLGVSSGEGTYTTDYVDLGSVQTCRCRPSTSWTGVNSLDLVDDIPDIDAVDNWDGQVDGVGVEFEISTSQDDPTSSSAIWSDWSPLFIGDYTARAFKFKAILYSTVSTNYVQVDTLSFIIDMPDRIASNVNVSIDAGGTNITFSLPFMETPSIYCSIRNAATGDTVKITSPSTTGFTAQVVDSGGSGKSASIDWFAKGY